MGRYYHSVDVVQDKQRATYSKTRTAVYSNHFEVVLRNPDRTVDLYFASPRAKSQAGDAALAEYPGSVLVSITLKKESQ